MDFGGYRSDDHHLRHTPAIHGPTIIITTGTGIPLSDRFKIIQQVQDDKFFSQDGYGLPAAHRYGGDQGNFGGAAQTVPKAVAMRNQQSALALARRHRAPQPARMSNPYLFRNRGAVHGGPRPLMQSRMGFSKVNGQQMNLPMRGMMKRGVSNRGVGAGRGMILNRVQKVPGSIHRNRNNQGIQVANRGQRGAGIGRPNRGVGRGGRGGGWGVNRGGKSAVNDQTRRVSKEDLDSELDSYMANSKANLDKELDDYMQQGKPTASPTTAGSLLVEESDDVNMTDP